MRLLPVFVVPFAMAVVAVPKWYAGLIERRTSKFCSGLFRYVG